MKSVCDLVLERVALDEPIGELAPHVEGCERCRGAVALPAKLGGLRKEHDPGLGFAARMTVAAQHRLALRHRRRIAGGMAATVGVGALAVFVMTRSPARLDDNPVVPPTPQTETRQRPVAVEAKDLQMLVNLADTHRARHVSAPWGKIQRPLAPYRKLVKGVAQ